METEDQAQKSYGDVDGEYSYGEYEGSEGGEMEEETEKTVIEKKEICLSNPVVGYGAVINKKAQILGVKWKTDSTFNMKLILEGDSKNVAKMISYLNELDEVLKDSAAGKIILGESIIKKVNRTKGFDKFKWDIEKMAASIEVFLQVDHDQVQLVGYERRVNELIAYMYEKEAEFEQGDQTTQELNISTFHRAYKAQIQETAHELELQCEFGYDTIKVSGLQKNVDQVILYLLELESKVKRNLFPKYWDFKQPKSYCMINVHEQSEEFASIREQFEKTMKTSKIIAVSRVQNKFVMDHYVCMLQKRMELSLTEAANRKLLFFKSDKRKPSDIYQDSDTGFDIQYGSDGDYGWGLYFSEKASAFALDAYTVKNSRIMILADVFIGKPFESPPQRFVKAPEGYDCVRGLPPIKKKLKIEDSQVYVVYNNFYSYPLYVIEYC